MFSTDDFERIQWHDNAIHAFRIVEGEVCGDLVLDIDFIVEWLPPVEGAYRFRVAPSNLTFHEVSDLVVSINYAAASAAVGPMTIREIRRESVIYPNGYSSFVWKVELNWPPNSFFTQVQRMEPIVTGAQYLSIGERTEQYGKVGSWVPGS